MSDIKEILLTEEQIKTRVKEVADQINADYENSGRPLLFLGILRGSVIFYADLVRHVKGEVLLDFMSISSYGASHKTSGEVRLLKDLDESLENKDVIIVEDIVDTGLTLSYLKETLEARKPHSLKICCLLDKPERRKTDIKADYVCFTVPNEFVVGYGLDYAQRYRNLPFVGILDPKVYTK